MRYSPTRSSTSEEMQEETSFTLMTKMRKVMRTMRMRRLTLRNRVRRRSSRGDLRECDVIYSCVRISYSTVPTSYQTSDVHHPSSLTLGSARAWGRSSHLPSNAVSEFLALGLKNNVSKRSCDVSDESRIAA